MRHVGRKGHPLSTAVLFLTALAALSLMTAAAAAGTGSAAPPARSISPQDAVTLDTVMKTFYGSLTFPEGKGPDWVRYKSLFLSASAPLVRTTPGNELVTTLEGFDANLNGRIQSGVIKAFYEAEVARTTETFGRLALVFSTYEKGLNTTDPAKLIRGVNSLQLVQRDGRWWIVSVTWEDETPGNPLPAKYVK